ncbi:hypothetical protein V9W64_10810 [Neisseria leonii]|uniref:Antitoxin n=1 Tax=Neisseria leonii TaxID=2995413 RepID=A0A9X4E2Z1_9NEIS|nr:hypothetical protein [Neisseria sp. 51.81]MDD9326732.1 hypothetical protein [Neisseria sp. 51.81]
MTAKNLDPLIYEFETEQGATEYGVWLSEKIERVLSGNSLPVSHEEVVARSAVRREELLRLST